MSEVAVAVIIVLVFFLSPLIVSIRALSRTKKIPFLLDEIHLLKEEIQRLKAGVGQEEAIEETVSPEMSIVPEESLPPLINKPPDKVLHEQEREQIQKKATYVIPVRRPKKGFKWKWNQERLFAFLGAFLGIIGLVFLTLYLGTIIGIFSRFMIMAGFSALLLGISFPLGKRPKWDELAHISRSFSGALFLFAVFASSTIEGLKWIENPLLALGVISAGTLYNLLLGGFCKKKGYMVFHMAINFLVIFLLPTEPLVFWLAFILTLGLQVFGFIKKEEINSRLSFLLFTLYCLFFKETAVDFLYFSWCFNFTALVSFINLILNKEDRKMVHKVLSYAMPLLWVGVAAYLGESRLEAIIPLIGGTLIGSVFKMGKARDLKNLLYWPLQILVTGTLLILASGEGTQYWLVLLYIESSIFAYAMIKEMSYQSIPLLFNYLILISAVLFSYLSDSLTFNVFTIANRLVLVATASFFMMKAAAEDERKSSDYFSLISIFQFILPFFVFLLTHRKGEESSFEEVLFFAGLSLLVLLISNKSVLKMRTYGMWISTLVPLFLITIRFIDGPDAGFYPSLILIFPLLIFSLALIFFNRLKNTELFPDLGIYLFTVVLIIFLYFPFSQLSSILPGVLILLTSFVYYLWWEKTGHEEIQSSGIILLLLFFLRHITHHLQMENLLGFLSVRLILEISALFIFYFYLKSPRWGEERKIPVLHKTLQGTLFTLSWLFLLIMIFSHSNRNILSLSLQLSIVLLLFMDRKALLKGYPLVSLAYIHFILAQLNLTFNTHPSFPFLPGLLRNPWIFGFVNVGASIGIIFLFFRHTRHEKAYISPVFNNLKKITDYLFDRKNLSLLIPLFISLGLFFNWTLEETSLTIALFSGCFLLYGTALILKENVFRHATSVALLATSVRLIFWDLAQSTMLAKSIAFLGASIIFILINVLYSQFKGRFDNV